MTKIKIHFYPKWVLGDKKIVAQKIRKKYLQIETGDFLPIGAFLDEVSLEVFRSF